MYAHHGTRGCEAPLPHPSLCPNWRNSAVFGRRHDRAWGADARFSAALRAFGTVIGTQGGRGKASLADRLAHFKGRGALRGRIIGLASLANRQGRNAIAGNAPLPIAKPCLSPIAYCPLPIAYCQALPIAHCPLPIAHCPLPFAHCPLPIALCPLPIAHCLSPSPAHCPLPIAYRLSPIAYRLSPIAKPA